MCPRVLGVTAADATDGFRVTSVDAAADMQRTSSFNRCAFVSPPDAPPGPPDATAAKRCVLVSPPDASSAKRCGCAFTTDAAPDTRDGRRAAVPSSMGGSAGDSREEAAWCIGEAGDVAAMGENIEQRPGACWAWWREQGVRIQEDDGERRRTVVWRRRRGAGGGRGGR